ncbi:MAG: RnfABCDGE type electron transport complex subunit D [Clostridia bacterium]|nr:RnfABCDGE type electron transport complex subunit D [Clostridia bacterium]
MKRLHIGSAPHICTGRTTRGIMLDVIIALIPTSLAGIIIFGIRAVFVLLAAVLFSVLAEYVFCLVTKRENTVGDLSAVVTGLLLGLNLPANTPIWQAAVGAVFATLVVKCFFGGIGQNFANPAITARIFMLVAFSNLANAAYPTLVDTVSGATPLQILSSGKLPSFFDLFFGLKGGSIGEVCIFALLIGGIYLIVRGVILPHAPVAFILTVFGLSLLYEGGDIASALAWCLSGGVFISAIFMATDYSSTPITPMGKAVFGVGAGAITVLIRFFGTYPEGASFAILLMNIITPFIEKITARRPFGSEVRVNE